MLILLNLPSSINVTNVILNYKRKFCYLNTYVIVSMLHLGPRKYLLSDINYGQCLLNPSLFFSNYFIQVWLIYNIVLISSV